MDYNPTISLHIESITPVKQPILQLSSDILWSMERQSITSLVTIDLSAAFDTVDHEILLNILKHKFGIEGKALQWFNNYLRPRSFKVITDGTYSQEQDLEVSVLQGSCVGAQHLQPILCAPLGGSHPPWA